MHTRANVLGVQISAVNMTHTLKTIERWIIDRDPHYVCVTPAHGVMDCQDNPELRQIFNSSGLTTPDGMAIVWLLYLHGHRHVERVYGPDLMLAVCEKGLRHGWRHFFYGGAPGVPERLAAKLQSRFPGLQIVGHHSPPFRPLTELEDQAIIEEIKIARPDVVWVGISTPKQESWMSEHVGQLNVPALVGVGAAFDFLSGTKKQAPRWVQRSGLEWFYRLLSEPRRLWRRYIRYPAFTYLALSQLLGFRTYPIE